MTNDEICAIALAADEATDNDPKPDDVKVMVENLRSRHRLMYKASPIPSVMTEAADMLERLAHED